MSVRKVAGNSRIAEVDTVAGLIVAAHGKSPITGDTHLPTIIEEIMASQAAFQESIQQTKTESSLADIDTLRDEKYHALGYLISGALYHPAADVKDAALVLREVFEKYGHGVVSMSYNEESSHITNLLGEFAEPEMAEKAALIDGLPQVIGNLTEAQGAFDTVVSQWKADKGSDGAVTPASTLRRELIALLNGKIVPYVSIMSTLDSDLYSEFAQSVSEIINDNNENVKRRSN